jgi:hypothetical protein
LAPCCKAAQQACGTAAPAAGWQSPDTALRASQDFCRQTTSTDGLQSYCKDCKRTARRSGALDAASRLDNRSGALLSGLVPVPLAKPQLPEAPDAAGGQQVAVSGASYPSAANPALVPEGPLAGQVCGWTSTAAL